MIVKWVLKFGKRYAQVTDLHLQEKVRMAHVIDLHLREKGRMAQVTDLRHYVLTFSGGFSTIGQALLFKSVNQLCS